LDGASTFRGAPKDAVPAPSSPSLFSGTGGAVEERIVLLLGESHVLADETIRRFNDPKTPADERETIRFILTVTALNEGEMPQKQKRD